jgi:putative endonuclease
VGPFYYVDILASKKNGTLYVGVTNSLQKRLWQHRHGLQSGFAHRYEVSMLVFFEEFRSVENAIAREKQLKAGSRKKKIALIEAVNPEWLDLSAGWYDEASQADGKE